MDAIARGGGDTFGNRSTQFDPLHSQVSPKGAVPSSPPNSTIVSLAPSYAIGARRGDGPATGRCVHVLVFPSQLQVSPSTVLLAVIPPNKTTVSVRGS